MSEPVADPRLPTATGRPALVGMVHLRALPGSPGWDGDLRAVERAALDDVDALVAGGCDALLVENMHDLPYLRGRVAEETVAAAAVVARAVVDRAAGLPVGIQLLAAANTEALAVALAAGARFLRVEGFAYGHVADEGWIEACAGPLLRRRAALGADVAVVADIRKKHAAHAATGDLTLAQIAHGTVFCGADALVVTGSATGAPTDPADVAAARSAGRPVWVGSGVTPARARTLAPLADALVVGTALKAGGDWRRPVALGRVRALREALEGSR